MLANNNKAIINKLAKNSVRTNRKQYGILFFTIILSAFMLFCVFTTGITYLNSSRLQNTRLNGAEYDIATMNGFTQKQLKTLQQNPDIESVGVESYAGFIKSTEFDNTVEIGLLWCDEVFWEKQMAPARTRLEGNYPREKNELMVTKDILKACGNENLSVGDRLVLTYENNTGVYTGEFVISGIWNGYGDRTAAFVSKAFYEQAGYDLKKDGILCIKLSRNYVLPSAIDSIEESLDFSGRQIFAPTSYIENSFKLLLGICGLALVICLSAYLLIYNILYLSVSGKIRYYGLLQSLGMTKKQLVYFIVKQILPVGIGGILTGALLGIVSCSKLVPYIMDISGIGTDNLKLQFSPIILLISVTVTGVSILFGIRKPIEIAAKVTPVEAAKYREFTSKGKGYKTKKKAFFWRMAFEQLRKGKKKTVVVLLSLATSLSVFYCLTTIITSQGERTVMPNYWNGDLIVQNQTQTSEDMNSLKPAIDNSLIEDIGKIEGIKDFHLVEGVAVSFPYDADSFALMWLANYVERTPYISYEETLADYRENPEKYYGMLKGIDDEEFDYLNQSLGGAAGTVSKEDFVNGEVCIVQYAGSEIPEEYLNRKVDFVFQNQQHGIRVGAVSYEMYYGGRNIGPTLIVSQDYLEKLSSQPTVLSMNISYDNSYDEKAESRIMFLLDNSPYSNDLYVESQYENMKIIQESQGNMLKIGTTIALLLLFVGALNYVNTIASSIQTRKLTFSVMESIGMSRKQTERLLIREGILYAMFSVFITLTAGSVITYICFQSMNYMEIPFRVPGIPLMGGILLIMLVCVLTPIVTYKKTIKNRPVAQRLREYE